MYLSASYIFVFLSLSPHNTGKVIEFSAFAFEWAFFLLWRQYICNISYMQEQGQGDSEGPQLLAL